MEINNMYMNGFNSTPCQKCGGYIPGDPNYYLKSCRCSAEQDRKNKSNKETKSATNTKA